LGKARFKKEEIWEKYSPLLRLFCLLLNQISQISRLKILEVHKLKINRKSSMKMIMKTINSREINQMKRKKDGRTFHLKSTCHLKWAQPKF
jgi:hypothetical protein